MLFAAKSYPLSSPSVSTLYLQGTREYNLQLRTDNVNAAVEGTREYNQQLRTDNVNAAIMIQPYCPGRGHANIFCLRNWNVCQKLLGRNVTQPSFLPARNATTNVGSSWKGISAYLTGRNGKSLSKKWHCRLYQWTERMSRLNHACPASHMTHSS